MFLRDAQRQRDLIREVDDTALPFQLLEHLRGARELDALQRGMVGLGAAVLLQRRKTLLVVELDDAVEVDAVVGGLLREVQDRTDDARLPLRTDVLEGHTVEDARAELGALRRRE